MITLYAKLMTGIRHTIEIEESALYQEYIDKLAEKIGVDSERLVLTYLTPNGGIKLDPTKTLQEQEVYDNTTFDLMVRFRSKKKN